MAAPFLHRPTLQVRQILFGKYMSQAQSLIAASQAELLAMYSD